MKTNIFCYPPVRRANFLKNFVFLKPRRRDLFLKTDDTGGSIVK